LLDVLYECEVWSVILTEERRPRVVGNRVLTKIFGPKGNAVTGEWRRLHNELNDLYCLPNIIRVMKLRMRWSGQVACMWENRDVYRILVGKPEGKRPFGRSRGRWEGNSEMDLQEV
jgi:hypothetical protein